MRVPSRCRKTAGRGCSARQLRLKPIAARVIIRRMARVVFENVTKQFDDTVAVRELSLDIGDGDFLVLVGPSGCGKSTALRMVAGLEEPTEGTILIADRPVNNIPPGKRDVAMVFQSYALYPQMSVYDNLAFGLRNQGVERSEIDRRVGRAAQRSA